MKSGLKDRNNGIPGESEDHPSYVSMKSGLEDRNNGGEAPPPGPDAGCLNEVRPGRPEQ